ncbi:hypothetical protein VC35_14840 [Pseudomonas fluorescens]|uniref:Uncharacterized protein n=1 Tax=Pseudomonas fluorescens TaxID=294 RepID=A0A0F4TLN2_PSEFL|nr:hypothetical protein VC35_14840 [Pseudomonas fluorescens]
MVMNLWRGGLSDRRTAPIGSRSGPKTAAYVCQTYRIDWFYDCFAAERGQAPSPQVGGDCLICSWQVAAD